METKRKIRQEILTVRDQILPEDRREMTGRIFERIKKLPAFQNASQILMFIGYGSEPETLPWILECTAMGKKVFCPRVCGEVMEFYEIKLPEELQTGYKGILEPAAAFEKLYVPGENDFMLLPGTVFDREGNRIGYGKGFYDRYLSDCFTGESAAVAFSVQITDNGRIPAESTDQKVTCIVTEDEIIAVREE